MLREQSFEQNQDSSVLIGEGNIEEAVFNQAQRMSKSNPKSRIIISDNSKKLQQSNIFINDHGDLENSYEQQTQRFNLQKISPKRVVSRYSKSNVRGPKQQLQNQQQPTPSNRANPYQSVLQQRPSRKLVKLDNSISKFMSQPQKNKIIGEEFKFNSSFERNYMPETTSSNNNEITQDLNIIRSGLNDSLQSSSRQQKPIIHRYIPQTKNNIIIQNHKSPDQQNSIDASNNSTIQKRKSILSVQRSTSSGGGALQILNNQISQRKSQIKDISDAQNNSLIGKFKYKPGENNNLSLDLSTERKSKLTTFKVGPNYDSIKYNYGFNGRAFDIEDMHLASVMYHRQLKTIEVNKKGSQNVQENDQYFDNDFSTVLQMESEINIDDE